MAQKTNWDVLVERVNRNRVLVTVGVAVMLVLAVLLWSSIGGQSEAPDFTLTDTAGAQFSLSDYEGGQVVILDFMFSTCEPCAKLVKDALKPYSKNLPEDVAILSISVFGEDSASSLREHAEEYGWRHALGGGGIEEAYKVTATPKIFIIDKEGQLTYSHLGPISLEELELEVDKALTGQGSLVKVKETSIFLFAIGAGVAVFFSPCSFPLLPGYMTYYLSTKKRTSGTLDERTAREALPAGLAAASGVTGVLLLIGILLVPFVSLLGGILPLLELLVGLIIFALGVSMLLDYSLEPMLQPLRQGVAALGSAIERLQLRAEPAGRDGGALLVRRRLRLGRLGLHGADCAGSASLLAGAGHCHGAGGLPALRSHDRAANGRLHTAGRFIGRYHRQQAARLDPPDSDSGRSGNGDCRDLPHLVLRLDQPALGGSLVAIVKETFWHGGGNH